MTKYRIVVADGGKTRPLAGMRIVSNRNEAEQMIATLNSYQTGDEFSIETIDESILRTFIRTILRK